MIAALKMIISFFLFCLISIVHSDTLPVDWYTKTEANQIKLRVDLFLSSTCASCQQTDDFFKKLEKKESFLDIHRHVINQDKAALLTFSHYLKNIHADDFSVPSIFFCNSRWVGFSQANDGSQELVAQLNYCHQQISKSGLLSPTTVEILRQRGKANWLLSALSPNLSAGHIQFLLALSDAFNFCSFFGILTLFAFLCLQDKFSLQLITCLLFIVLWSLIHFIQQLDLEFFYAIPAWLRLPLLLVGFSLLIFIVRKWLHKENKEQKWLFFPLVFLVILAVAIYQFSCSPNFSLVFQQWLNAQHLSTTRVFFYQLVYQVIYLLPLLILMAALLFIIRHKKAQPYRSFLMYLSYCLLVFIACFLIGYPQGLSRLNLSFISLLLSLIAAYLLVIRSDRSKLK